MDIFYDCQDCVFGTNSPKQAKIHTDATKHTVKEVWTFDDEQGAFFAPDGRDLLIEPDDHNGTISEDSYFEE
jgi:hypothetical protein